MANHEVWKSLQRGDRDHSPMVPAPMAKSDRGEIRRPSMTEDVRAHIERTAPAVDPFLSQHPWIGNGRRREAITRPEISPIKGGVSTPRMDKEVSDALLHSEGELTPETRSTTPSTVIVDLSQR